MTTLKAVAMVVAATCVTTTNLGLSMTILLTVSLLLLSTVAVNLVGAALALNSPSPLPLLLARRWLSKLPTLVVTLVVPMATLTCNYPVVVSVSSMVVLLNGVLLMMAGAKDTVVSLMCLNVLNFLLLFKLVVSSDLVGSRMLITHQSASRKSLVPRKSFKELVARESKCITSYLFSYIFENTLSFIPINEINIFAFDIINTFLLDFKQGEHCL
jgi:hypothetical protein